MTVHTYDLFGWYSADAFPGRNAGVAPKNKAMPTSAGDLRANWTGYQWVDIPYSPPPPVVSKLPVPESVLPIQGLLAIDQAGLAEAYEAWAKNPARTFAERAFIERATVWKRDNPIIEAAAADLGISAEALDDLFRLAGAL